jgi:hypothetical protein
VTYQAISTEKTDKVKATASKATIAFWVGFLSSSS